MVYKSPGHYPTTGTGAAQVSPSVPSHLLKQRTVRDYAQRYGLRVLIETGTYYGEMVAAMKKPLCEIHSVNRFRARRTRRKKFSSPCTCIFMRVTARKLCRNC